MTIGYLHVGPPAHGVTRYGHMLAQAARAHLDTEVIEAEVELNRAGAGNEQALRAAARQLAGTDVIHLQHNDRVWGGAASARYVQVFEAACSAPLVVTLHDVRRGYGWTDIGRRVWAQRRPSGPAAEHTDRSADEAQRRGRVARWGASLRRALRYVWKERQHARATRFLARRAGRVLVCTHEEARRLHGLVAPDRLAVVPHFVEAREVDLPAEAAKQQIGLAGRRLCTVLGFIHRAKGHALVVEAMPRWDDDVHVVFAGRAGLRSQGFLTNLRARATALGVSDRLHVTGYLPDEELDRYLAATDLALCPFEQVSASGSLATWIGAGRPILASDLPQIAEYNALAPGAIPTFAPYTPAALAAAVRAQLGSKPPEGQAARTQLREKLSLPRVIQQHAAIYRQVAVQASSRSTPSRSE